MLLGAGRDIRTAVVAATTTSGDNTIVAADSALKIKVVGYVLVASAGTTITFKRGTTALTGAMAVATNGVLAVPVSPQAAWFQTAVNEALVITLGAGAVQGHIIYVVER